MTRLLAVGCCAAAFSICATAAATPKDPLPAAAEATKTASAWLRAMAQVDLPEAARLATYPFRAVGFEGPTCKGNKTALDEAALREITQCAQTELVTEETKRDVGKDDLAVLDDKTLKRAGWKQQRKHLLGLMREERLVWRIYQDEDVLHIVVLGVRKTPNGLRVTSLAYHTDTLTEE